MKLQIFPVITEMPASEMVELAAALNHPSIQKYFHSLGVSAAEAICEGQRNPGESAESYLERVARVQGGLAVIKQLLAIEPPAATPV